MTKSTKFPYLVRTMTIDAASYYARSLVELETRGADTDAALHRLEQRYGLSPHQIQHLRSRRAKSCDVSLFARLKGAYLDVCERQVSRLQHQIAIEKATDDADDLRDLEAEAAALAAKIAQRKARLK